MRISDLSSDVCSSDLNKPHILGELDAGQMNTIQLIAAHHPISAPDLAKLRPNDKIGTTAWNNRLATLSAKGMLKEVRQDRKSVVSGTSVSVRVDRGGRRIIIKKPITSECISYN